MIETKLLLDIVKAEIVQIPQQSILYWDLCSGDKPANVPVTFPEVNEYLNLIHVQNGKAVIAHPGANFLDHPEMVEAILDLGADGLEAYSSYHTKAQCEFWAKLAKDHHKQVTIGSIITASDQTAYFFRRCRLS